jgi:hypothetical protein
MTFDEYTKDMPTEWDIPQDLERKVIDTYSGEPGSIGEYFTHKEVTDPEGEKYYPMEEL